MDYISAFDIRLTKDIFYAGENVTGSVLLENTENIKIKGLFIDSPGWLGFQVFGSSSGGRSTRR